MNIIQNSINEGIKTLNKTLKTYKELYEKAHEFNEGLKMSLTLMDSPLDGTKYKNSVKKMDSINSRIDYINFIIKQIENIKYFVKLENREDFNNFCLYFGTQNFYYSEEFLKLSSKEIFETILNHIFHYTGCLYIVINDEIKLSYITTAFGICLGKKIDFKLGRNIYKEYSKELNVKILNTKTSYRDFIIRNHEIMPFFNNVTDEFSIDMQRDSTIYLTFRILLGNIITLQNMYMKIGDPREIVGVSNVIQGGLRESEKEKLFSIA